MPPSPGAATGARAEAPFWTQPIEALRAQLGDGGLHGLDAAAVAAARAQHGDNVLVLHRRRGLVLEYLARFRNPMVLLLLAASALSAVLGDATSVVVIALIVAGSVTLDFIQERRAGRAAEALRASVALSARVLREGQVQRLPVSQLVPGDRVQLGAGDLVPADGRLVEARDFFVRQSTLTGESFPVEKRPADLGPEAVDLTAATNGAFMGSSVLSGSATLLVCRTGPATLLGSMADALRAPAEPSAFERGTQRFGMLVLRMTFVLVLFIVAAHVLSHRPVEQTVMFAVALAVGLTPELLPMIVSVTLARGALRLAAQQIVVKRLNAIQDLGSMDVLCTDKTGTLTEGSVQLELHVDAAGRHSPRVFELAFLNSHFETGLASPLDKAVLSHAELDVSAWRKLDEVPFGFERRRVSVLLERGVERLLVVKGAPEDLLRLCTQVETGEGSGAEPRCRPMDEDIRRQAQARVDALGAQGLRVLVVAWRAVAPEHGHAVVDDESELVLCGFAAFRDPPKAGADEALAHLRHLGVHVKVLTGDTELVTRHVCEQLQLPLRAVLTGAQVDQLDDHALLVRVKRVDAFCRVSPPQKSRILRALQRGGHVVGFLGDGVNDAPALHDADVGISVAGAVDVAREAADMIMMQPDLRVLRDGVTEGRRTFANVMKYIMMATSSNFGNMASMAAASLLLPVLPMLPVQILLNNLLYDLSEMAIPLDRVDAAELRRPHDWDPNFIRRFMLTLGPVSSLFDFATFGVLLGLFHATPELLRTGWFVESIATQVLVIFVIRTRALPWRSRPHPALVATSLAVVGAAVALPFTPLAPWLGFTPLPPALLATLATVAACYLACAELAKRWFNHHAAPRAASHRR